jgi:hypothetical protein
MPSARIEIAVYIQLSFDLFSHPLNLSFSHAFPISLKLTPHLIYNLVNSP